MRRETGKEWRVRVPRSEGVANHTGPESCVMIREDHREALTGDTTGWAIEPRNTSPDADTVHLAEGNTQFGAIASGAAIRPAPTRYAPEMLARVMAGR